ncbi:hypothetical protein XELAEV_18037802mg [Xenopus laevis]|uniref:L1 transposable element RRM domain-containing protein n=1 Tax=Xenopus laevis TaxID=8355 RepID=A0A974HAJ1_XENLA|nr:hypothetical protein XELAEV_18037802mg [Xenopus laevis]
MSAYITAQLTREIRELGHRTDQVESKLDEVVVQVNAHEASIVRLSAQHDDLLERLEDYENRSRRNNIRIRGLSEDVKDLHTAIPALLATLVPELPKDRLELDRVHRALGPRRDSGIPRDIRRRALRPITQLLQQHKILYHWGFPFKLTFSYNNKQHVVKSSEEGLSVLRALRIIGNEIATGSPSVLPSLPCVSPQGPLATLWEQTPLRTTRRQDVEDGFNT